MVEKHSQNLSRIHFVLLLGCLLLMLAPHLLRMPLPLSAFITLVVILRCFLQWGYLHFPGKVARTFLVMVALALFFLSYRFKYTVESAVVFLSLFVVLKLLEVRRVGDTYGFAFVVIYLGAMQFLMDQGIATALWFVFAALFTFGYFIAINQIHLSVNTALGNLKSLLVNIIIALPFVVALFLFFPRLSPLWTMPLASGQSITGMSDRMSPGDIANLSQSAERVFRVTFDGQPPPPVKRYWKGLFFDEFDGREWRSTESPVFRSQNSKSNLSGVNKQRSYQMLLEPTGNIWAFTLENSLPDTGDVKIHENGLSRFGKPLEKSALLKFTQYESLGDSDISPLERHKYTEVGRFHNPQTRAWINDLKTKYDDPHQLTAFLLSHFNREEFYYTLNPPLLGRHSVDEFLFESKRGFCEHYAGALTFMLREAGIPARVVAGYQGGEWNAEGQYLMVHQYDAHAWVEAWYPDVGWKQLDPTAQVALSRIESGLREAVREEGSFLSESIFSAARYEQLQWLQWIRLRTDAIGFQWQKWVVGYDVTEQSGLVSKWREFVKGFTWYRFFLLLGALFSGWLFFQIMRYWLRRRTLAPEIWLIKQMQLWLTARGCPMAAGETIKSWFRRATDKWPEASFELQEIQECFYELQYNPALSENDVRLKRQHLKASYVRLKTRIKT